MRKIYAVMLAMLLMLSCIPALAEETAPAGETMPAEETAPAEGEWWNILLLGGDARDMTRYERTDTIIILSINQEQCRAKLTSVMRDTWVTIPGIRNQKITSANFLGGADVAVQTVNKNFGTDIEDYILINMADMAEIVDLFGGIDIEISASERKVANDYIADAEANFYNERLDSYDYTRIASTGLVHLNGVQTMAYCRDRYTDSDFGRVMRAQKTLLALAGKAQNLELEEVVEIAGKIGAFVSTNLTEEEIKALAMAVLVIDPTTVEQFRVPADGTFKDGIFDGTWMLRADLEKNQEILRQFIYEDKLPGQAE